MSSTASPILAVELQGFGENRSTWGGIANGTYQRLEDAIAGEIVVLVAGRAESGASEGAVAHNLPALSLAGGGMTGLVSCNGRDALGVPADPPRETRPINGGL